MGNESQSCKRVAASDDHRSIPLLILMSGPVCVGNNMLVCGVVHRPTALNPFRGSCTLHILHDLKAGRRVCEMAKPYQPSTLYIERKLHMTSRRITLEMMTDHLVLARAVPVRM